MYTPSTHKHFASERAEKGNRQVHIQHTCSLTRALSLACTHKHTHTYIAHTHTDTYTFIRILETETLHERTEILTSHLKTKHATYIDMYTCTRTHPQRISTSLQKRAEKDNRQAHIHTCSLARTRT